MKTPTIQSADGVFLSIPGQGIGGLFGNTVPTDGTAGYVPGCLFLKINGTGGLVLYVNNGTLSSCDFNTIPAGGGAQSALTTQLTEITIADAAGTPDYALQAVINSSAYGFASAQEAISFLYVVQNLQVRVGEIESKLQSAGILA